MSKRVGKLNDGTGEDAQRGPGPPHNLLCEVRRNPRGIDGREPRLSWQLADRRRGARQAAYRILVASDEHGLAGGQADVWDSGVVKSDQSVHVPYGGPPSQSRRRYHWTVRTWDQDGCETSWATPAYWEMGLLATTDWEARWISAGGGRASADEDKTRESCRSQFMRREFQLDGEVTRARAYVSGLGCYELWLNGQRVGRDVFTPGWTNYARRIQYQTYDVTSHVCSGPNAIGAVLGSGWWAGGLGLGRGWAKRDSTGDLRLILQLEIEYADGTQERIVTDDGWRAHPSPILENSFYHGETYDARLETPGWERPGFDDGAWAPVVVLPDSVDQLVAQQTDTIQVAEELPAQQVTQPREGVHVFDFGQNHAGWARLRVRGEPGTRVQIRLAEILRDDGLLDRRNLVGARATDTYVLQGGQEETWEPRFTYRGYRYAELTGYSGRPPRDALVSRVVHSAVPSTGRFACSNDLLNRIQQNILWALRSNLYSVPTDCPQRDERLGWTGDAHVVAPTACWNMNMATFLAKYLRDMRDSQHESGYVLDVAPAAVVQGPAAPGWGDAIVGLPWTLYRFYRDQRVIEENYDAMRRWVEYMRSHAPSALYICPHDQQEDGYGDWVATVESPKKPIATAYYYYSTNLLARMAAIIGRSADAEEYAGLARRIAAAFNAAFFEADTHTYLGGTQTAHILPLAFGLAPPEHRPAVLASLVRDIAARDEHLSTGFIGTAYALPLLSDHGHHELAYRVATQRAYPSWGYMIECGATTMCELWSPDQPKTQMNSWNHFALGSVGQWFYESLAGIRFTPDPFGRDASATHGLTIRPRPAGDLTWVKADYESIHGPVRSHWHREDDHFRLDVTVPPNTTARICVPTLGAREAVVAESDVVLLRGGAPVNGRDGLRFHHLDEEGFALFDAVAGSYAFVVQLLR